MTPDEKAVLDMVGWAHDQYQRILAAIDFYEGLGHFDFEPADRATFAKFARNTDEPALMFALLDGHDLEPILYRRLRKRGTVNQWKEYTR